ncbi:hypothetical protein [Gracilinema caldarium]|uniref:Uncharacterized protein n=1 Tax=Gracilinema caldarium (strain ATCC 51460 / DSM 7334 / H1) TaxID=744872 RepID=F8F0B5_GRAC1|nr:hypothetical protein [Gracilinema caldarium]AEJ18979.1 hypothetical protein Spica_0825 [Gracilinema caldarium DSM 7334]
MGETIEKLEQALQQCRASYDKLLIKITELEKELEEREFHHRNTRQLLLSIIDMDTVSGGDRTSLKRRIKMLSYIDDHLQDAVKNYRAIPLYDILLAIITNPHEFSLPPGGIHVESFFEKDSSSQWHHTMDTQTALLTAICISDIFAGLFTISESVHISAYTLERRDRLRFRCHKEVSSRLAEELLSQIERGPFFSLLNTRASINFLPPNPQEGPGVDFEISYNF